MDKYILDISFSIYRQTDLNNGANASANSATNKAKSMFNMKKLNQMSKEKEADNAKKAETQATMENSNVSISSD